MSDKVSVSERSRIMARVPSKNSTPEIAVRKALHAAGFRFSLHRKNLSGKPDIVLARFKTVVLVHGCLWHGHGCKRFRMPTSNVDYWSQKISRNVSRDAANLALLEEDGWCVKVVWECQLESDTKLVISHLSQNQAKSVLV